MAPPAPAAPRASVFWALFGLDGRIGREVFWLSLILLNLITAALLPPVPPELLEQPVTAEVLVGAWLSRYPLAVALLAVGSWILLALFVKRLHDRGLTGWLSLLLMVPFVNLVTFIFVGMVPGTNGPNAFGPRQNGRGV